MLSSRYRKLQHELDEAEERADKAESTLSKMRSKTSAFLVTEHDCSTIKFDPFIKIKFCELSKFLKIVSFLLFIFPDKIAEMFLKEASNSDLIFDLLKKAADSL